MKRFNLFILSMVMAGLSGFCQTATLPISEDFENETALSGFLSCQNAVTQALVTTQFTNATNDGTEWTPWAGATGSGGTGPTNPAVDHNPGTATGVYMVLETSGSCSGLDAYLEGEFMDWSTFGGVKVSFWYHMFGGTMGTMHFDIRQGNGPWTLNFIPSWTDNQDIWQEQSISIFDPLYVGMDSVQIRIRGIAGTSFTSDMAIDDISIDPIVARNLAVLDLVSPQFPFCAGTSLPISATVVNDGTDTITSFTLYRTVNGALDSNVFNSSLNPGDTVLLTTSSYTFAGSGPYDIEIYTSLPNGMNDQAPGNDTLRILGARTGLAPGTYTLDPALPASTTNFISFNELQNTLNDYGVCGAVTVNVAAGTYTDALLLETIDGTSPTARVTIDGGDSSLVFLSSNNTDLDNAVVRFENTSYVTIKNMTISSPSTNTGVDNYVIHFSDASNYDSIVDCHLSINPLATFNQHVISASSDRSNEFSEGNNANHTVIMGCRLVGGDYSVRFEGEANAWNVGNKFLNNVCVDMEEYGIYTDDQDSLEIIGNNISGLRTTSTFTGYGTGNFDCMNFKINSNIIDAHYTGIYVTNANAGKQPDRAGEIINNMVSADLNSGIWTTRARWVNYWNNSIYCNSADAGFDAALYLDDGFGTPAMDSVDVRNNVMFSTSAPAFRADEPDSIYLKFNNNVFESNGTDLFNMDGTLYADLPAFQVAFPSLNANSLEGDPQFVSATDLHIVGAFINNTGDNSVPVTVDIDGDPRPITGSTTVDPGADEFDPPLCPPPSNLGANNTSLDSATIFWDGNGNSYQYEIVPSGNAQGSGTTAITGSDSLRIGGLMAATTYDYYVREVCGRGDTSIWSGPITFNTAYTIPFSQDFESFPINTIANWPEAWTSTAYIGGQGFGFGWEAEVGQGVNPNSTNTGALYDHTQYGVNGGTYIYMETSGGTVPNSTDFVSPPIFIPAGSNDLQFSYWYFMFGANIDRLEVYVSSNAGQVLLTTYTAAQQINQTDPWRQGSHTLSGYSGQSIQLIFRGYNAACCTGDIAIDDVSLNELVPLNAGVVDVFSPQLPICPGPTTPIVGVANLGTDTLSSVQVFWDVNGTLDSTTYNGQILPGDTVPVTLGSVTVNASTVYDISFYTQDPNGMPDQVNADDTLSLAGLETGISAGTYTIDSSMVTGGTNFQSFVDFADAVSNFGLCGAVTVDVVVGSGPYNQQVVFDNIEGSSSTNTITINGNGESLDFASNTFADRAVITIDNSSWITIDSLNINADGGIYGWGIHLTGNSDNVTIRNCEIDANFNTNSNNFIPIVASGSPTSSFSTASVDFLTVDNNTLIGGNAGVSLYGVASNRNFNNTITNNDFVDNGTYSIYAFEQDSMLYEGNESTRPNRTTFPFTSYSIGLFGTSQNCVMNANAIHNMYDGIASASQNCYPVYVIADAAIGNPNFITNNLIYNINTNGTIYAIYEFGSDGANYLNNTISLDDVNSTTTNLTRGFYQTGVSANSSFLNNIISITRGGTGNIHGIYLQNTGTTISVDYNDVYVNSASTGTQAYGFFTNDQITLANWQANTTFGQNSFDLDPRFFDIANNDYTPQNPVINDIALPATVVSEDFFGVARSATPDPGAIEFNPSAANNVGITGLDNPFYDVDSCYSASEDVSIRVRNLGGSAIDFTVDTMNVVMNVSGSTTATFSFTVNTNAINGGNPLGIGSEISIPIGTIDMTTIGGYDFDAHVTLVGDTFPNSDSLISNVTLLNYTGGTLSGTDSICAGDTTTLTADRYNGQLQWQELVAGTWTDIAGETGSSIDVDPSVNTDYRVLACGTASSDTITVVPIVVSAPTVVKNDPVIVACGQTGTDTLIMAGVAGSELEWFDAAVGGNSVNTGDTLLYVVSTMAPASSATDTFYVQASTGSSGKVGPVDNTIGAGGNANFDAYVEFVSIADVTLRSVLVYPQGPGNIVIELTDLTNTVLQTLTVPVTVGGAQRITLDLAIAPGSYRLNFDSGNSTTGGLFRNSAGGAVPYSTPSGNVMITGGSLAGFYYFFYDWEIVGGCTSSRTMVIGNVDCLVGLDNTIGETATLTVSPNPSNGLFTLDINTQSAENFNLTVRDVNGKLVFENNVNVNGAYKDQLDFTSFSKGVYYMQIQTATESKVEKLIIQ